MAWYWAATLLFGTALGLMMLGVPVALGFLATNLLAAMIFMGGGIGIQQVINNGFGALTNFPLVPIPMFLLMGELFYHTGLAGRCFNAADKLLGETRRHFKTDFDLVVTAQQVRSYKPDPAHFKEAERRIGSKKGWVHVASSYYYDVEPCIKAKVPVIWVNRNKETLDASQKKPTAEVKTLLEAAKLLGAA